MFVSKNYKIAKLFQILKKVAVSKMYLPDRRSRNNIKAIHKTIS